MTRAQTGGTGSGLLRRRLSHSRLFIPARDVLDAAVRRGRAVERRRRLEFLRTILEPGMLVFDVGANVGEYTDYYRRLGCRVVAIEPNPPLAALIRARMPDVPVVEAALGVADGQAELHIGPGTGDSTLSDRYAAIVEERTGVASRPVTVRVTTISRLASKFGFPDYIKIDVEGAERDVLAGRGDVEPPIVSFEVHGSLVDEADACLALLPDRTFSLMIGEDFAWSLEVASREQVIAALRELSAADSEVYGDVFCFRSVANSGSVS